MPDTHRVAISLGSNQGDSYANVQRAADELAGRGLKGIVLSPLYRTSPVDCPADAPDFINAALTAVTSLSAEGLLDLCRSVEESMGRPSVRGYHEDRVIDLDLLLFDELVIESERLRLPHPELTHRLFVLAPLADIAADWDVPPTATRVGEYLDRLNSGDEHVVCLRD